jgi:hypothetical protein
VVDGRSTEGVSQTPRAERAIGNNEYATCFPDAVGRLEKVSAGWHQHGDSIAGENACFHEVLGDRSGGFGDLPPCSSAIGPGIGSGGIGSAGGEWIKDRQEIRCSRLGGPLGSEHFCCVGLQPFMQPIPDEFTNGLIECDEVTGIGESVDVCIRSAPNEIGKETIVEDRIPPTPDQQHGNAALFKGTECLGCTEERCCRWVRWPNGDIGDESSDSAPTSESDVRGVECFAMDSISHPGSAAHE